MDPTEVPLETIRELSDALVELQRPIRVLDAVAWDDSVRARFFAAGAGSQPQVDRDYYLQNRALGFDPQSQIAGFEALRARITNQMGDSAVGSLMTSRVDEYMTVIEMLGARGTTAFTPLSTGLYGGVNDLTHPGGPSLLELGEIMDDALTSIADGPWEAPEGRSFDASVW